MPLFCAACTCGMNGCRRQERPTFMSAQIANGTSNPLADHRRNDRRSCGCRLSGRSPEDTTAGGADRQAAQKEERKENTDRRPHGSKSHSHLALAAACWPQAAVGGWLIRPEENQIRSGERIRSFSEAFLNKTPVRLVVWPRSWRRIMVFRAMPGCDYE